MTMGLDHRMRGPRKLNVLASKIDRRYHGTTDQVAMSQRLWDMIVSMGCDTTKSMTHATHYMRRRKREMSLTLELIDDMTDSMGHRTTGDLNDRMMPDISRGMGTRMCHCTTTALMMMGALTIHTHIRQNLRRVDTPMDKAAVRRARDATFQLSCHTKTWRVAQKEAIVWITFAGSRAALHQVLKKASGWKGNTAPSPGHPRMRRCHLQPAMPMPRHWVCEVEVGRLFGVGRFY